MTTQIPPPTSPRGFEFPRPVWEIGKRSLTGFYPPYLMGILNATPDSFSDGGQYSQLELAVAQALKLVSEGAALIDIGGESTRPGSEPVPLDVELERVIPVVEAVARVVSVPISIDTTKSEVARQALEAGATIVNDISGLRFDPQMVETCARAECGVICMHIQGTPQTMQANPHYVNVVVEVRDYLAQRVEELEKQGIARERIAVDPGIGFGKSAQHNIELLSNIGQLRALGRPVLIGHSRKRFLGKILGKSVDERSHGTVGVSLAVAAQGADIIRLHEIAPTRDSLQAWLALGMSRNC